MKKYSHYHNKNTNCLLVQYMNQYKALKNIHIFISIHPSFYLSVLRPSYISGSSNDPFCVRWSTVLSFRVEARPLKRWNGIGSLENTLSHTSVRSLGHMNRVPTHILWWITTTFHPLPTKTAASRQAFVYEPWLNK